MGRISPAAVIAVLGVLAPAAFAPAQEKPDIRVDVRLVRLLVTVKNTMGQVIGGLDKKDFAIYDNGVRQEVALFERHTEQPLSVAVLVDTSGSTAKDLKYEIVSVQRFFERLLGEGNPRDEVKLYSFNYDVRDHTTRFTRNLRILNQELVKLKGEAGTALWDAICFASESLELRDGRHVIVLVTDGGDTASVHKYQDAREAAHRADAPVYSILVVPITNDAGRNIGGENALITLGVSTGGKVFFPTIGPALDSTFADILRDLRTQYLIGFYPKDVPKTKNRFHSLKVVMPREDLRAETRTGYYGDAEQ